MSDNAWAAVLVAAAAAVVLTWLQRRHVAAVQLDRSALFEPAAGVLADARLKPRGLDFPVLYGSFEGRAVRVEPVVDAVGLRMVPVLRLVVTVRDRLAGQPRLSVLADESGHEFYAGHRELRRLRDPGWPARVSVASEVAEVSHELVDAAVTVVARDPSLKQVLVTERGVRCVVRAAGADAATYRVTRRIDLAGARVPADLLREAVQTAGSLCDRAVRRATPQEIGTP